MPNNRIDMVDALRGYALLGLFLVHCVERFELYWLDPMPDPWFDGVMAVFAGKSFAIFALLFGFSFATIMANERARKKDFTLRFVWRLVLLFGIGTLHALVYRGDILQVLAAVGLLMIPFDRVRSDKVLLAIAFLLFLQIPLLARAWFAGSADWTAAQPYFFGDTGLATLATGSFADVVHVNAGPGLTGKWSFYLETGRVLEVAGLFLIGMVLQRRKLFAQAAQQREAWLAIAAAGAGVWILVSLLEPRILPPGPDAGGLPMQRQAMEWFTGQWRALSAMALHVSLFVLAWHSPLGRGLATLAPAGKMTLTLYVGQSLVAAPLLYGFGLGLFDDLSSAQLVGLGVVTFAAQMALAALWFRYFRYGPLEWLWRAATRTDFSLPIRAK
ncbi:DUF418 domain-containing protein [Altererythrobacter sp. Root672]|uniref:DUF418 domain-containing protein n=1 Tax=Altererythrobacter sp. Root672 TaxID=1736584 RepID=UPI000700AFA8|nr:DUF418 domain-containing protein [Altererythrobacter sp. Root672]KRA80749.1 hypothetical protein ASD76_16580 [Altererythrobacter sp. Root672]